MTKSVTNALSGDGKGMLVTSLCFVHCVAGPVLLSIAGFSSLIGLSEKIEPVFLISSITFGALTLVPAYRKQHRRRSCLTLFSCGILCLLIRRYGRLDSIGEMVMVGLGATLIIGAHALNLKFSKQCRCCQEPGDACARSAPDS
jgi:hypothetical protein